MPIPSCRRTGIYRLTDSAESLKDQKELPSSQQSMHSTPLRYPASIPRTKKPPNVNNTIVPIPNGQSVNVTPIIPVESGKERVHTTKLAKSSVWISRSNPKSFISFVANRNDGHRTTSGAHLTVTKSVQSPRLPVPLVMTYTIKRPPHDLSIAACQTDPDKPIDSIQDTTN